MIKIKHAIFLIFISISTFLIFFFSIRYFIKNLDKTNEITSIINLLGTICGGIIGGVIAFAIARYQIGENNKKLEETQKQVTKNTLTLLKDELEFNLRMINISEAELPSQIDDLQKSLTNSIWEKVIIQVSLKPDLLNKINNCYRLIIMIKEINKDSIEYHDITNLDSDIKAAIQSIDNFLNS